MYDPYSNSQNGNILFLILLAIVLFAALNYAVSSSMRGGGKDGSSESAEAAASDILGWFAQLDNAVMRMIVVNNIPLERIDFNDPNNLRNDGPYPFNNTNCSTTSCEVFSVEGGGVAPRNFYDTAGDKNATIGATSSLPGHKSFTMTNTVNIGSPLPDISVRINTIKKEVCNAVNRRMGIPEDLSNSGQSGVIVQYQGNLTQITNALNSTTAYTWTAPELAGKHTFCVGGSSIYHVVVER